MAWSVVLPLGTLIYPTPRLSTSQIQISLTCFQMPSAHPCHGHLDGPPAGPFWLIVIFWLLATNEDAIPSPFAPQYTGPWINGTRWYSSLTQERIYPRSPPVPNSFTIPVLRLHRLQAGGTFLPFQPVR